MWVANATGRNKVSASFHFASEMASSAITQTINTSWITTCSHMAHAGRTQQEGCCVTTKLLCFQQQSICFLTVFFKSAKTLAKCYGILGYVTTANLTIELC